MKRARAATIAAHQQHEGVRRNPSGMEESHLLARSQTRVRDLVVGRTVSGVVARVMAVDAGDQALGMHVERAVQRLLAGQVERGGGKPLPGEGLRPHGRVERPEQRCSMQRSRIGPNRRVALAAVRRRRLAER